MVSKESLKVSEEDKKFLDNIMINRIKLDQDPLPSYSAAIGLMRKYFKLRDKEYLKMIKEEKQ